MLRVLRSEDRGATSFALSGRIEEEDVPELKALLNAEVQVSEIAFDLEEVRLVAREAVKFLADCECHGIKLRNCPAYVREWIEQGGYKP
jgi:predicted transcriptional regulator